MQMFRGLKPAVFAVAPPLSAALALLAGVMLLASGATPSEPERFVRLLAYLPPIVIELSHFVSSILGLLLVLLAFGLRSRLGAAWTATQVTLAAAALLALAKGFNWEESAVLLAVLVIVAPFGAAFPRTARLNRMEITPGWMVSAAALLLGAALLGWWSFDNADYGTESWWRLMADADAERAIRSSAGAAVALFAVGVWRMLATAATPPVVGEEDPDFARVRAILANAEHPEPWSNLALLGDKRFLFSASGESFLMFGVRGRSWIALGGPVGRRDERMELLWRFRELADAHAARPALYGIGPEDLPDVVELGFSVQKTGESAATPPVVGEEDPDFARVRAILARAEHPEPWANLALLGDKRFLFSVSGESFLMFGVRGRSWIAIGGPVGRRDERMELLWRFRELADAHAARPALYGIGPEDLPDVVELGFSVQKTGESAATPLDSFSLEGRRRGVLRRAWRKTGEEGAGFEVLAAGRAWECMDQLQRVSDDWLAHHAGGEKGFSMGGFHPRYAAEFPVAVVRTQGRVVAFATLWTTPGKQVFSIDLMRYDDGAPKNVMDYLFVELLHWGREQGYTAFEFGMAPLAGLDDRPLAPIMSRVGRLLFERGEEIYNFRGVRRYKDKYDPVWQPRYIAAPWKWAIPMLLADVGLLSSGGVAGLARRPRRAEAPAKAA